MIKNIIFDFGGVLFNINYNHTIEAFKKIGLTHFENIFSQFEASEIAQDVETGKITAEQFYTAIQSAIGKPIAEETILNAWNAMLLSFRKESLEYLKTLSKKYNLYLLSNTNQIHYDAFIKMLHEETDYESLESFFTMAYYSHIIHLRKPNIDIYEFVLKDANIKAEETLFIDDTSINLTAAGKLGIKTYLLLPNERIENLNYESF